MAHESVAASDHGAVHQREHVAARHRRYRHLRPELARRSHEQLLVAPAPSGEHRAAVEPHLQPLRALPRQGPGGGVPHVVAAPIQHQQLHSPWALGRHEAPEQRMRGVLPAIASGREVHLRIHIDGLVELVLRGHHHHARRRRRRPGRPATALAAQAEAGVRKGHRRILQRRRACLAEVSHGARQDETTPAPGLTQALAPGQRRQGAGTVVHACSAAGVLPRQGIGVAEHAPLRHPGRCGGLSAAPCRQRKRRGSRNPRAAGSAGPLTPAGGRARRKQQQGPPAPAPAADVAAGPGPAGHCPAAPLRLATTARA
mmetsp:Transcript_97744/g.315571  ORF Transcript_97744/g.315571 Transcript_97744/m.315571 type:complete len:314 (+) Transcript_97744:803-1744(+)